MREMNPGSLWGEGRKIMEYGNLQAQQQLGSNPKESTRSERLVAAWDRFASADFELHNARQQAISADKNHQVAYQQKEQSEQNWSKASQELADLMMQEAPERVKEQVAQQAAYAKQRLEPPMPPAVGGYRSDANTAGMPGVPRY